MGAAGYLRVSNRAASSNGRTAQKRGFVAPANGQSGNRVFPKNRGEFATDETAPAGAAFERRRKKPFYGTTKSS
jgi:hypothetical protein